MGAKLCCNPDTKRVSNYRTTNRAFIRGGGGGGGEGGGGGGGGGGTTEVEMVNKRAGPRG